MTNESVQLNAFDIGDKRTTGEVIKENEKTVMIRAPDGKGIKRHKVKHNVTEVTK